MTSEGRAPERIVSLLPAGTEIVAALGALAELVGVSHECDYPSEVRSLPRVTSCAVDPHASSIAIDHDVRRIAESGAPVFALDAVQLAQLAPTLIITQTLCDVCAVSEGDVRQLGTVLDPAPRILPLTGTTLDGVWTDIANVGEAIGREAAATALLHEIAARLRRVHETLKAARAPRPRVAVIEWLDPLFAAGHWTPELVRRAGGVDVLAEPGAHSAEVDAARVRDARPTLLLFAPCGFDLARSARDSAALLETREWEWAAGIEAWALDGNALTSRPGPRLADAVETIAGIIAPSVLPAPSARYARRLV